MKLRYDGKGDTLDIIIQDAQIHHAEEFGPIIVNYDADNRPVEIEFLNASKFLGEFLTVVLRRPEEVVELTPRIA